MNQLRNQIKKLNKNLEFNNYLLKYTDFNLTLSSNKYQTYKEYNKLNFVNNFLHINKFSYLSYLYLYKILNINLFKLKFNLIKGDRNKTWLLNNDVNFWRYFDNIIYEKNFGYHYTNSVNQSYFTPINSIKKLSYNKNSTLKIFFSKEKKQIILPNDLNIILSNRSKSFFVNNLFKTQISLLKNNNIEKIFNYDIIPTFFKSNEKLELIQLYKNITILKNIYYFKNFNIKINTLINFYKKLFIRINLNKKLDNSIKLFCIYNSIDFQKFNSLFKQNNYKNIILQVRKLQNTSIYDNFYVKNWINLINLEFIKLLIINLNNINNNTFTINEYFNILNNPKHQKYNFCLELSQIILKKLNNNDILKLNYPKILIFLKLFLNKNSFLKILINDNLKIKSLNLALTNYKTKINNVQIYYNFITKFIINKNNLFTNNLILNKLLYKLKFNINNLNVYNNYKFLYKTPNLPLLSSNIYFNINLNNNKHNYKLNTNHKNSKVKLFFVASLFAKDDSVLNFWRKFNSKINKFSKINNNLGILDKNNLQNNLNFINNNVYVKSNYNNLNLFKNKFIKNKYQNILKNSTNINNIPNKNYININSAVMNKGKKIFQFIKILPWLYFYKNINKFSLSKYSKLSNNIIFDNFSKFNLLNQLNFDDIYQNNLSRSNKKLINVKKITEKNFLDFSTMFRLYKTFYTNFNFWSYFPMEIKNQILNLFQKNNYNKFFWKFDNYFINLYNNFNINNKKLNLIQKIFNLFKFNLNTYNNAGALGLTVQPNLLVKNKYKNKLLLNKINNSKIINETVRIKNFKKKYIKLNPFMLSTKKVEIFKKTFWNTYSELLLNFWKKEYLNVDALKIFFKKFYYYLNIKQKKVNFLNRFLIKKYHKWKFIWWDNNNKINLSHSIDKFLIMNINVKKNNTFITITNYYGQILFLRKCGSLKATQRRYRNTFTANERLGILIKKYLDRYAKFNSFLFEKSNQVQQDAILKFNNYKRNLQLKNKTLGSSKIDSVELDKLQQLYHLAYGNLYKDEGPIIENKKQNQKLYLLIKMNFGVSPAKCLHIYRKFKRYKKIKLNYKIMSIVNVTPVSHNGLRGKKHRRKKSKRNRKKI